MARQIYKTDASQEYVITGNDAIIKCQYPSFVSDLLTVTGWQDSEGAVFKSSQHIGKSSNTSDYMCLVNILIGKRLNLVTYARFNGAFFSIEMFMHSLTCG